ncbi:MAG: exonuclease domain-containing protein, partial [Acidimicrobiia bacterium]
MLSLFPGDTPDTGPAATPLSEVTFAVVDLETTGTVPGPSRIIEVGAAKFRGGECVGTFQTMVNPGCGVPPFITVLTGITEAMLVPAPTIGEVLPTLLEVLGDAVLVGHNLRFDTSFLDAALVATGRRPLSQPRVDTLGLARRLLTDEVPNRRLGTLAHFFGTDTVPNHRALDDVLATAGVLHGLLERAGPFGILALDDLLAFPATARALAKLPLVARLPRQAGVYLFEDAGGRILHVGRAGDVHSRVRSYLASSDRRDRRLVRETARIDHLPCRHPLEAAVVEARLVAAHRPPFHRSRRRRRPVAAFSVGFLPAIAGKKPTSSPEARRLIATVRAAGRVVVESAGCRLVIDAGRLKTPGLPGPAGPGDGEALVIARWLEREGAAGRLRLVHSDGPLDALWP